MTDESGLTPEQEAVRRLLAGARHEGSTPPEVVARLEDTLGSLVAERASEVRLAPVVDLAARRRRVVGMGLLAAAAVVVAGVAIGQGLPSTSSNDSATSADAADSGMPRAPVPESASSEDAGGAAETSPQELKSAAPLAAVPTLSSSDTDLDSQLLAVRGDATRAKLVEAPLAVSTCELPRLGRGSRLAAQVDGQPGIVFFRPPDGAAQQTEVYVCGVAAPVRTLSLPAP